MRNGVQPDFVRLADIGIHGNGHMMMIEKNNEQVAKVFNRLAGPAGALTARARGAGVCERILTKDREIASLERRAWRR